MSQKELILSAAEEGLLKSFDLLPESERQQVAGEILRRTYANAVQIDNEQLAAAYSEFADFDRVLAEQGVEEYERGLAREDAE